MASDLRERAPSRLLRDRALLQAAFDGCGVPIAEAHRRTGTPTNDTAETLSLLGNLLMVTGTFCLPGPARTRPRSTADEARSWPRLNADEQLKMLKALMGMLTVPPPWRKDAGGDSAQKPMLPREMGRWDGRCDLPSCFGMLVILAGYGYLTKASMLAASVQRTSAEPVATGLMSMYRQAYRYIADALPLAFQADPLVGWLLGTLDSTEESAQLLATRREFHGAIVIRLKDGRWVSLDPYMRNMAILEQHILGNVAPRLLADPAAAEPVLGQSVWSEQPQLEQELRTVRRLAELVQTGGVLHEGMTLVQLAEGLALLLRKHSQGEQFTADDILCRAVTTSDAEALPNPAVARAIVASAESGSQRPILRERILLGAWRGWVSKTWSAAQSTRNNQPHQALVLSAPARTLGVWAAINLRHRLGRPVRAIDLLPYSGSDVVMYNAFADSANGQSNAAERRWLAKHQQRFRQMPPHLLHPLVLEAIS